MRSYLCLLGVGNSSSSISFVTNSKEVRAGKSSLAYLAWQLNAATCTCNTVRRRCIPAYGHERSIKEARQEVVQALAAWMSGGLDVIAKLQHTGLNCLGHPDLLVSVGSAARQPLFA